MNQLKAGAILNYVIIGLNTLVGLLYTPYMLRCLGQNEYGIYSLVASIIAYLTILDFGFGNAIIRYTAKFRAEGKEQEQWEMFGMFVIVYSIIGFIALLGGLGLYFNVDSLFDRTMTESDLYQARVMMILLSVNLAFTFPLSIFGSIISAYENFVFQRLLNIARIILSTIVMIVLLAIGFKAIALVIVHTAFNLATLLINLWYCFARLKIKIKFQHFNFPFLKEISIYSFWIFLNAIMDRIYWGTGQFILGSLVGTVAVAVFSVAILLQQMYMTFSTAICSVLLPRLTSMVANNKSSEEVSNVFLKTGRIQCIIISLLLSGFIVFGKYFIDKWAGQGYQESYIITLLFFVALFVPLIQNTGIYILQARNQMKFRSLLYLGISIASLLLQILLTKLYGIIGCAVAIAGALIIGQGIIMNIYYSTVQKIDIPTFWKQISKLMIVPIFLLSIGLVSARFADYSDILILICGITCFTILYIVLTWYISMNSYEKNLIVAPVRRIRKYVFRLK